MIRSATRLAACLLAGSALAAQTPMGTAFTYQGQLTDDGVPPTGVYDLRLTLHTALTGGSPVGATLTLDNVAVTRGVFTVRLDFGAAAFGGEARWLQIAVRPGTSTGSFTTLTPRQELTPTPSALYAAAAQTARTVAGLTCADGQVVKWSGGGWVCATDVTNIGTVTGVTAGAGLTGGTITTTGTIGLADGGVTAAKLAAGAVTTAKIAAGAVGLAQIDQAQVQARIAGTCPIGQYFRGIAANGTVLCEPVPGVPTITTVDDPDNSVGAYNSIAVGADGLPVISYWDLTAGALKVAKCGNAACSAGNTITTVDDPDNHVGMYTSIAVGADGLSVIGYYDVDGEAMKVARCGNAACSAGNTITTVDDPANNVGRYLSIAIGADGLPVFSYYDLTAKALKVLKCGTRSCQ